MALITRISRLFRADFNAVLDRIEEPDVLLKQALREMEEDLQQDQNKLKFLQKEYSDNTKKTKELSENMTQIDNELDICFESDETELARNQVKRKLELQRYEKHLNTKLTSAKTKIAELTNRIDENKNRLAIMQQKLELLISDNAENKFNSNINSSFNESDVDMAYLKEKQARSAS